MPTFAEIKKLEEEELGVAEAAAEPTGEVSQYYDIGWDPATWKNIPKELLLQAALSLEPGSEAQGQIVQNLGPEGMEVNYNPEADTATATDPLTGQTGYINEPGISTQDVMNFGGLAATFTPAGRAGKYATAPGQLAARTGALAAGTEAGRQTVSNLAGAETRDENTIPGLDLSEIGMAGATQMVPDYLTANSFMSKYGPASWQSEHYLQRMQGNLEDLSTSGLQALRGQVSEIPAESRDLKVLGQMKHSGPDVQKAFEQQNRQAVRATDRLLEGGPLPSLGSAGADTRAAAETSRELLVQQRKDAEGGLYNQAFGDIQPYETDTLTDTINTTLETLAPGSKTYRKLSNVRQLLGGQKGKLDEELGERVIPPSDPRTLSQMHDAKMDIDAQIEAAKRKGDAGLARQMTIMQGQLVDHIQDYSPDYAEAREIYRKMSLPINQFDQSLAGKILDLDETQTFKLGEYIFNPRIPNSVRSDFAQKLQDADPNAFHNLATETMRGKLAQIRDIGTSDTQNVPYQILNALFKNEREREMWKSALPDKANDLDALVRGLQLQGRNRSIGSDTAFNQEARDRFGGTSVNTGVDLAKEIMEWVTVVPKVAKYAMGGLNEATAKRRQGAGVLAQQDLSVPEYLAAPQFSAQNYPRVMALIQAGRAELQSREGE